MQWRVYAIHARHTRLMLDVARWRPSYETLSIHSPNAGGLPLPELHALGGDASILNAVTSAPDALASRLIAMGGCLLPLMSIFERYLAGQ